MDPQSIAFVPHNESWRLYNDLLRLQQVQTDHADRLLRLERRQDDDARMKSVWGGQSPFPSVLSGTPQQAPIHHLKDFDDDSANLIGSLHLDPDPDEEPRRMGTTSRANSVRFDESANQGHWAHNSRSSIDFIPRSASSMGGLGMTERTYSHKSDGRASSVHSVRSAASGRASSINLDTSYLVDPTRSPFDTPAVAPGLLILGPVPSIVRCWMNTNFKHDALLYAAVSTASYKSQLHLNVVQRLGLEHRIIDSVSGGRVIELPVYFAEAVPHPAASSRSSSPAPQVPSVTVEFNIIDSFSNATDSKAIQIFIGSDVLRSHSADVLFSSNTMTLYDDDQCKLSVPLVRPENEGTFNCLYAAASVPSTAKSEETFQQDPPHLNGLGQSDQGAPPSRDQPFGSDTDEDIVTSPKPPDTAVPPIQKPAAREDSPAKKPSFISVKKAEVKGSPPPPPPPPPDSQPASSPSIWSNWRRETPSESQGQGQSQSNAFEWGNPTPKSKETGYQRRDTGIKVLRPTRTISRTFSGASVASSSSPADAKSRFFEEGKKRSQAEALAGESKTPGRKSSATVESQADAGSTSTTKTRANPAGGASAFAWLNSKGKP